MSFLRTTEISISSSLPMMVIRLKRSWTRLEKKKKDEDDKLQVIKMILRRKRERWIKKKEKRIQKREQERIKDKRGWKRRKKKNQNFLEQKQWLTDNICKAK